MRASFCEIAGFRPLEIREAQDLPPEQVEEDEQLPATLEDLEGVSSSLRAAPYVGVSFGFP
jgi:hypothetical protein